jgi:ankyrin repeat protein
MPIQTIKAGLLNAEIIDATEDDELDTIEDIIVNKGADPNKVSGDTVIGLCLYYNRQHMLKRLIELGANPDLASRALKGCTPLWYSLIHDMDTAVKTLIDGGAEINSQFIDITPFGNTSEERVEQLAKKDIPTLLEEKNLKEENIYKTTGATLTPLIYSLSNHRKNNLTSHLLNSSNLEIDKKCGAGITALDMAIRKGHHNFVEQMLMQHRASLKIKSLDVTPGARAAKERRSSISALIKKHSMIPRPAASDEDRAESSQATKTNSPQTPQKTGNTHAGGAKSSKSQTKPGDFAGHKTGVSSGRSGNNSIKILSNKIREALSDLAASTIDYCEVIDPEITRKVTSIVKYFLEEKK